MIPPTSLAPVAATAAAPRFAALDAYRGFIMLLLVSSGFGFSALQSVPGWEWLARQVEHAEWEGCTFWDLIQPAFTFMVGVAMTFSLARRRALGHPESAIFRHIAWRAFLLIFLSNLYSNWGAQPGHLKLQFINVLSQIAFGYVICAFLIRLPVPAQILAASALLAGHWTLFALFPAPAGGPWAPTGNIGAAIDLAVLGYNYSGSYTTINFLGNTVTIFFGCWAGALLQSPRSHRARLSLLALAAVACLALGLALQPFNPMVKRLWTASFTFYSAGWIILMLCVFYWLMEMRKLTAWAFPFLVLGANSLFVYSLGQIGISGWLSRGLASFTNRFAFLGPAGAIPHQLLVLAGLWYVCFWLHQRRIFFRI